MKGSKPGWLTIRMDPELQEALDRQVAELQRQGANATKSELARALLGEALGSSKLRRAAIEHHKRLAQLLRKATQLALQDVTEKLPDYLDQAAAS